MLTGEKLEWLAAPDLGLLARGAGAHQPENGWGPSPGCKPHLSAAVLHLHRGTERLQEKAPDQGDAHPCHSPVALRLCF